VPDTSIPDTEVRQQGKEPAEEPSARPFAESAGPFETARAARSRAVALLGSRLWRAVLRPGFARRQLARAAAWIRRRLGLAPHAGRGLVQARAQVAEIVQQHAQARATIVFLPSIEWDLPLFQRPQQLALALAEMGALVFYVEPAHAGRPGLARLRERLYVGAVPVEALRELQRPVAWTLCWNTQHLAALTRPRLVYDHIDDLSVFDARIEDLRLAHARLLREAELVFTTARRLQAETEAVRPDARLVPNGVDERHFASARQSGARPVAWTATVPLGRPVIGYYGALARWFDYALVAEVARSRPDYSFVLIGPDHDGSLRTSRLLSVPNVHWLGVVPHAELPEHLRAFDVATIPFVVDDVTHAVSPLKLFEYMAAGKPIVVTALAECQLYAGPLVARDAREFALCLDHALRLRDDDAYAARLSEVVRANTWLVRARQILASIEQREGV